MTATGPLQPTRDDGTRLDATFELAAEPVFELVYHHKAGGRDSPRAVNSDYHEGLELLLARLAVVGATILGISVDSSIARELPEDERELGLPFPIRLHQATDVPNLRLQITRSQKPVARRPDAKPKGGNDQKRIRISFRCHNGGVNLEALRQMLAGG